jgi:hypothetical protein
LGIVHLDFNLHRRCHEWSSDSNGLQTSDDSEISHSSEGLKSRRPFVVIEQARGLGTAKRKAVPLPDDIRGKLTAMLADTIVYDRP